MKPLTDSDRYNILAAHQGGFSDMFFVEVFAPVNAATRQAMLERHRQSLKS